MTADEPTAQPAPPPPAKSARQEGADTGAGGGGSRSAIVAGGILLSRLAGFARQRAIAHFFGLGPHADVFSFALRAPNLLQNLLGEGTLSASFIPVYARLLEEKREEEAGRLAGAIFGLLLAVAAGLALVGVLLAAPIVAVVAPGFLDDAAKGGVDRYRLAVTAVRITFPMTGALVLHAWALGVLNSHRRFFLPYFAPVLWNAAIIAALAGAGQLWLGASPGPGDTGTSLAALDRLLFAACFGGLVGGFLQFLVQLPMVLRVSRGLRPALSLRVPGVRKVLAAFGPVVAGRGVVQIGSYLDVVLASFLLEGAMAGLGFAQVLYLLPISLFAMSVAAAELPELSRVAEAGAVRSARLDRSLRQIAFFTLPTVVGYFLFGYLIGGALFRTGSFGTGSTLLVALILFGYTLGLPASAASRLFQNVFFALGDTKTPAKIAAQRVVLAAGAAAALMFRLDQVALAEVAPGFVAAGESGLRLGAVGLGLGSAVGAWYEVLRLAGALVRRDARPPLPWAAIGRMAALALAAAALATLVWWLLPPLHPVFTGLIVVGLYAALYLGAAQLLGFPEIEAWSGRLLGRLRRRGR